MLPGRRRFPRRRGEVLLFREKEATPAEETAFMFAGSSAAPPRRRAAAAAQANRTREPAGSTVRF